jgi:hypothetical protein
LDINSSINVLGGLKTPSLLFTIISDFAHDESSFTKKIIEDNHFNIRTEKSRKRLALEVRRSFVNFRNDGHKFLLRESFSDSHPLMDRSLFLIWQYALNNDLFREISTHVFVKLYLSGRSGINKNDIIAFVKDLIQKNNNLNVKWAESTIGTIATKYLNFMDKMGFLTGGRNKSFVQIRPSSEAQVIFLCFAHLHSENQNLLRNEFLPLSFIPTEDLQARLKKLSLKGYFNMNFNGVSLNIELTKSYQGICDALYH